MGGLDSTSLMRITRGSIAFSYAERRRYARGGLRFPPGAPFYAPEKALSPLY